MSKIAIDLVKLIEQAIPQLIGTDDARLLLQWLARNSKTKQMVTIDLFVVPIKDKVKTPPPNSQPRIKDVITFSDDSELRIQVLTPPESGDNFATDAYYGLLPAISNIQAKTNKPDLENLES